MAFNTGVIGFSPNRFAPGIPGYSASGLELGGYVQAANEAAQRRNELQQEMFRRAMAMQQVQMQQEAARRAEEAQRASEEYQRQQIELQRKQQEALERQRDREEQRIWRNAQRQQAQIRERQRLAEQAAEREQRRRERLLKSLQKVLKGAPGGEALAEMMVSGERPPEPLIYELLGKERPQATRADAYREKVLGSLELAKARIAIEKALNEAKIALKDKALQAKIKHIEHQIQQGDRALALRENELKQRYEQDPKRQLLNDALKRYRDGEPTSDDLIILNIANKEARALDWEKFWFKRRQYLEDPDRKLKMDMYERLVNDPDDTQALNYFRLLPENSNKTPDRLARDVLNLKMQWNPDMSKEEAARVFNEYREAFSGTPKVQERASSGSFSREAEKALDGVKKMTKKETLEKSLKSSKMENPFWLQELENKGITSYADQMRFTRLFRRAVSRRLQELRSLQFGKRQWEIKNARRLR